MVDLVRYEGSYDVSVLAGKGPVTLDRWIIDPAAGKVTTQRLDDRSQEFPRVDDRVISRPYRYGYSAFVGEAERAFFQPSGDFADEAFSNALFKHDLAHGTVETHQFGRDATAGEAVFAPATPDAAEDDGYVMAFVHNPHPRRRRPGHPRRPGLHRPAGRPVTCPPASPSASTAAGSPTSKTPTRTGRPCTGASGDSQVAAGAARNNDPSLRPLPACTAEQKLTSDRRTTTAGKSAVRHKHRTPCRSPSRTPTPWSPTPMYGTSPPTAAVSTPSSAPRSSRASPNW